MKSFKRMEYAAAWAIVVALVIVNIASAWARQAPAAEEEEQTRPAYRVETTGQGIFGGERVRYRAIVAETFITDEDGERTASLVTTSYVRSDTPRGKANDRPIVFVFNGGPGSAGLWLQMGLVGPRRVDFDDDVNPPTVPPYRLADNTESILDVADVVIFDPPGTGYSRVLGGGKPEQFFGVNQDARITAQFVSDWVREHGRFNSPRFLLGESYGTIRAAAVAKLLAGGPFGSGSMEALTLNGVILLGQALGSGGGDSSLADDLPSFAATAWYHERVSRDRSLEDHVADARSFAANEYLRALYAGNRLDAAEKQSVAERLAALTGLPVDLITRNNLRIDADLFSKSLLAAEGQQVGKYDARFKLPLADSGNDPVADDPAMGQYVPAFVAALNMHMHDELGVRLEREYLPIEFRKVNSRWDYGMGPGVPSRRDYSEDLAVAMRRNPALYLFIGSGYFDLVTTVGSAEYTAAHAGFPPERVVLKNYASGHMPYLGEESRKQLADDLRSFIRDAARR